MGPCEQAGTYKNGGGIISILPIVGWLRDFLLANVGHKIWNLWRNPHSHNVDFRWTNACFIATVMNPEGCTFH
jgi:hypothetical protein